MDKNSAIKVFIEKFLGSSDESLIKEFAGVAHTAKAESKEIIFSEGDKAISIYYLISGSIKLSRTSADGKETVIRFVAPNEIFAEIALTERDTYPVNAAALESSLMLSLDVSKLKILCAENTALVMRLFASMASRLSYLVDMINGLTSEDAMGRLIKYLRRLAEKSGSPTVRLPVAKGELALLLGTTPETVSRLFTKLKNDGVISTDGHKITLVKI